LTLPRDWAGRQNTRLIPWPAGREEILERYQPLSKSGQQLAGLLDLATELGSKTVLLDSPYVDTDYRSEFSRHFSRRFKPPPDRNERLIFFADPTVATGMIVIRPTSKPVGRSLMGVPESLDRFVSCRVGQPISSFGFHHNVEGFPFMSQDGEYARCAHAAIWAVARYYHLKFGHAKHSMAAIVDATGTEQLPDRTTMSGGLTVDEVLQAFRRFGDPVFVYRPSRPLKDLTFERVMRMYLDSGFPIVLSTPQHLTVIIGYSVGERDETNWIRSDDNVGPYEDLTEWNPANQTDPRLGNWQSVLVPLPGRIHIPAESAFAAAMASLEKEVGATGGPGHLRSSIDDGEIESRTFAVEPARLKSQLLESGRPAEIVGHYVPLPMPVWAWMTEFYFVEEGPQSVFGSILIDATSSRHHPSIVAADIDGWAIHYADQEPVADQVLPRGSRYESLLPNRIRGDVAPLSS
jgi:hypothetical protein